MSLSTAFTFPTLPPTLSRRPLHDGRSDSSEVIKLANEHRALASATYRTVFDFVTPGDATFHSAWSAQLGDGDTWYASVFAVAKSGAGTGATWRRESLITRSGATVTVQADANVAHQTTAGLVNFDIRWAVSLLYGVFQLRDDAALPGTWRVSLEVVAV